MGLSPSELVRISLIEFSAPPLKGLSHFSRSASRMKLFPSERSAFERAITVRFAATDLGEREGLSAR
jgi:hypothetical protein